MSARLGRLAGAQPALPAAIVALAAVLAAGCLGFHRDGALDYGALGTVALAAVAARWPGTLLALASLLGLALEYAAATDGANPWVRGAGSVVLGIALYGLHELYALATATGRQGELDGSVLAAAGRAGAPIVLAGALLGVLAALIGDHAPDWTILGFGGLLAAVGLALGPFVGPDGRGPRRRP